MTHSHDRLPWPLICQCGFNTISKKAAVSHIKKEHPFLWAGMEHWDNMTREQQEADYARFGPQETR